MVAHVTAPAAALLDTLPTWATLCRAPNPGPMTLDGTNTWVLRAPGARHAVVVDAGPADEAHLAAVAEHGPVSFILLTHGHPDHVDGARRLSALLDDAHVIAVDPAHCIGAEPLDPDERLASADGIEIQALATPGHTRDSVSFRVDVGGEEAVLTGDTILGRGTTVVAWPDGDLGEYLASLRRLAALGPLPVLPGHGPALADCSVAAQYYLRHREQRLDQVREARVRGAETPREVVELVYADVEPALWPAAEWSVRAQLAYLDRERPEAGAAAELDEP